ncbi:MAG: hypothetical protein ABR973_08245 [Candidatus Acidiferrales bacterium]|jgi:hypothetical protein
MTENVGQSEIRPSVYLSEDGSFSWRSIGMVILAMTVAICLSVKHVLATRSHHGDWVIEAFVLACVIAGPWFQAVPAYRRISRLLAGAGTPPNVTAAIWTDGARLLWSSYWAVVLVLMMVLMLH